MWHTNPQWNWNQPQQWSHNTYTNQGYGHHPPYQQPAWNGPHQQPMHYFYNQQQPLQMLQQPHPTPQQPRYNYIPQSLHGQQSSNQNWNSHGLPSSHHQENTNPQTTRRRSDGHTVVIPRSTKVTEEESDSQKMSMEITRRDLHNCQIEATVSSSSNADSLTNKTKIQAPSSQHISRSHRGFHSDSDKNKEENQQRDEDDLENEENDTEGNRDQRQQKRLRKKGSKIQPQNMEQLNTGSTIVTCHEENDDDKTETEKIKTKKVRLRKWNIFKQVAAILLIILDVVFDWLELGEMMSEGEWSSDNTEFVSCSSRGDHLSTLFLVFTILGTLFAVFQIVNLMYQIYCETKGDKAGKKFMDGRTEVVIIRLLEEIPQLLLIIAFRAECSITCDNDKNYKNIKSAVSATFSISNTIWRHVTSLDGLTFKEEKETESNCCKTCSFKRILCGWYKCCCPCIACFCECTIPCFPCGKEFVVDTLGDKTIVGKCVDWGCESDFVLCVTRMYPSHLEPPETNYFEVCPRRPERLNFLTERLTSPLSVVHMFVYVIYVLNIICIIKSWLALDKLADVLF